jgi:threonine synthase
LILQAVRATQGTAVAVDDADTLREVRRCASLEGLFVCPEGAAALAAVADLRASGWISATDEVVVLNTGTGLIYPDTVGNEAPVLQPTDEIPA